VDRSKTGPSAAPGSTRPVVAVCAAALLAALLAVAIRPHDGTQPDIVPFLGRFHTLALHLPIGALLLVVTFEALSFLPRVRPRLDAATSVALPFFVGTALVAFTLGLLLASGGGYPQKVVSMHRAFTLGGILASAVASAAWWLRWRPDGTERRGPYRVLLAATVALITVGAHFGGTLTHGSGYLVRYAPAFIQRLAGEQPPAQAAATEPPKPTSEPRVYADVIAPLLAKRCAGCHGPDKVKGKLRVDSYAALMKGGENGAVVLLGRGGASPLVTRMTLPPSDEDRMPPDGKPGLSADEIQLVRWWIDRGATETLRVKDALAPEAARGVLSRAAEGAPGDAAPAAPAPSATGAPSNSTDPAAASAPSSTTHADVQGTPSGGTVWRAVVAPMLASRCGACHGAARQKGHLRVDSIAALVRGGEKGPAVVPGNAAAGTLLRRIHLPIADDDHMPPRAKPQLSGADMEVLAWWIGHGANDAVAMEAMPARLRAAAGRGRPPPARAATAEETPAAASTEAAPTAAADAKAATAVTAATMLPPTTPVHLYQDVVAPILVRRCGECHQGDSATSGLHVDDPASMIARGAIVPGKPDDSPLYTRAHLPPSDDDHMPPTDKPQPTPVEIDLIKTWIAKGAGEDVVVAASTVPPELIAVHTEAPPQPAAAASASTSSTPSGPVASRTLPALAPRAGGCASCTVGAEPSSLLDLAPALFTCLVLGLRQRSRRRRDRRSAASRATQPP